MSNVDDNFFSMTTIGNNTTFYDWVNHYNQNVVGKLNNIFMYDGVSGDGIEFILGTTLSGDGAGIIRCNIADSIPKGVTFEQDVTILGDLNFSFDSPIPATRFRVNGQTGGGGFTFGTVVRAATDGVTFAQADGSVNAEAIGIIAGITWNASDPTDLNTNYIDIVTNGLVEGQFEGGTFSPGCVYFLDAGTPGGLTTNEPVVSGQVSKPMVIGFTYDDATSESQVVVVNYRGQYLDTGVSGSVAGATYNNNMVTINLGPEYAGGDLTVGKVAAYNPNQSGAANGWFTFNGDNSADIHYAFGIVVNRFVSSGNQFIQVVGSGFIDNIQNTPADGLLYVDVTTSNLVPPENAPPNAKPMCFVWTQGGVKKAFVINQQVENTGSILAASGGGSGTVTAPTTAGFISNYRFSTSTGITGGAAIQPNLLINGGFDFWQRNIGVDSAYGSTGTVYFADRWIRDDGVSGAVAYSSTPSLQRMSFAKPETSIEGDPTYYLRSQHSVTGGTAGYVYIVNRIENNETLSGEDVTLSFYAKCGVTGSTMGFVVNQFDGTSKTKTSIGTWAAGGTFDTGLVSLGTTWAKYSISFNVPQVTTTATDSFVDIGFDVSNTQAQLDLAQVKLERGIIPTTIEPININDEYNKCKRYYQRSYAYDQATRSETMRNRVPLPTTVPILVTPSRIHYYRFPIPMRSNPSVTYYSPQSGWTGDAYNMTAGKDLRLTGGSGKDGSYRSAPAGKSFINTDFATKDGIRISLSGGVIQWDDVHAHYVADADLNTDLS